MLQSENPICLCRDGFGCENLGTERSPGMSCALLLSGESGWRPSRANGEVYGAKVGGRFGLGVTSLAGKAGAASCRFEFWRVGPLNSVESADSSLGNTSEDCRDESGRIKVVEECEVIAGERSTCCSS